ncbi:unnamed protein product, partial [marine sediment metagenome]
VPPERAYDISQGVPLTATPYGCSWWGFIQDGWGVGWRDGLDAQWRRLKWYEGILTVQRLEPYFARANNMAQVGIMIPRHPWFYGPVFINNTWRPLQEAHLPVSLFVNENQMDDYKVIVAPVTRGVSDHQVELLKQFLQQGGTVICLSPEQSPWERKPIPSGAVAESKSFNENLLTLLGVKKSAWEKGIERAIHKDSNGGRIILLPETMYNIPETLADIVSQHLSPRVQFQNLPSSYIVDHYYKKNQFS